MISLLAFGVGYLIGHYGVAPIVNYIREKLDV